MEGAASAAATSAPCVPSHSPGVRAAPVRVVARICPGGDPAGSYKVAARVNDPANASSASVSLIPIIKEAAPSGSMTPHKPREYKLDWCYLKDNPDTDIFQNEVKHLVDNIFCGDGGNPACVITCGSTAKSQLVMGSEDHPGLLNMAMGRILDLAKPISATVRVSSYQVLQDSHVFDLLEPKDSEVLVREDANGRTHLKGLSKVEINSIEDFQNLSYGSDKPQNPTKASKQDRGHRGFIIFISGFNQNGKECFVANMHFLELTGFAQPNSKKSLYAVMDVVQALNSHQSFIPYRKSKVTHVLQDSLCKKSAALLIAYLDEVSCQDAVSTLNLASRSSQVVNEQFYSLSLSTKGCSKSRVNLSNTKNLSRSLLPSIQQRSSVVEKNDKTQFNKSAVKATQALNANKRSESTHSTKKDVKLVSAATNSKHSSAKSLLGGRKLFFPTTNSSKEDKKDLVTTVVARHKEAETSICMEIAFPPIEEKRHDTQNSVISCELQEVVPCSMKELVSSDAEEEDHSSIQDHSSSVDNSYADLAMTCSSNAVDISVEKDSANVIQSSPKISDELREISNTLKLVNTMASSAIKRHTDIVHAEPFDIVGAEPKTPEIHLRVGHTEDPQKSLKAHTTGFKKSLAKECLSFINSASKEQLKSLKGIGEKRANFILQLREESPEPLKEIDDLKNIVGMRKTEISKMVSGMVLDLDMDMDPNVFC